MAHLLQQLTLTTRPFKNALEKRKAKSIPVNQHYPQALEVKKLANPFLRADQPLIAEKLGLSGNDPVETFAALRKAKDQF